MLIAKAVTTFKLFSVLLVLTLAGCVNTPEVFIDYDKQTSFKEYKTFSWLTDSPEVVAGDFAVSNHLTDRFTKAIKAELESKGYQFEESMVAADFLVSYTIGARRNVNFLTRSPEIYNNRENWLWGKEYHPHIFAQADGTGVTLYTKGVLAVDIFGMNERAPVWHSRASRAVEKSEPSPSDRAIEDAVARMLKRFPPQ